MRKINVRTIHRYLSVVMGVQLLLWTTSGLIFSFNSITHVRGEHLIRQSDQPDLADFHLGDIGEMTERIFRPDDTTERLTRVEARTLLDRPVYEFQITGSAGNERFILCDAETGHVLSPIPERIAGEIALRDFAEEADVVAVNLVEGNVSSHSEYRGKELPAWRVELDHSSGTVIYVSAHRGVVTTRRNDQWRMFDFFWMLHTMDYQGRDNFNSWLLKSFSMFGVATVISGYWLWWRTSRITRRFRHSGNNQTA